MSVDPKLKAYWYERLKESGFKDIEGKNGQLKKDSDHDVKKRALEDRSAREEYFALCSAFLHSHEFKDEIEREVWALHSDGYSVRKIERALSVDHSTVHVWIKRLRRIAGIK